MSRENPIWSADRIADTLRELGYPRLDTETIRKYMIRSPSNRPRSTTWLTFLHNHMNVSWAMDLMTVATARFSCLYILVILQHGRRQVVHWAVTPAPTMEWIVQQLREATPLGIQPEYLFRDNDAIYGHGVRRFLKNSLIEEVRTAFRSPWQNPYVERFFGTLRRELLDHVIVWGQDHLRHLISTYIRDYYHDARPHQGLDGQTPIPKLQIVPNKAPSEDDTIIATPVLGGLHHRYERIAA